jgi:hypothetical protein
MQFIAHAPLAATGGPFAGRRERLLVFQCANDPGLCDEWEPEAGGNAALVVPAEELVPLMVPAATSDAVLVFPERPLAAVATEPPDGWLGRLGGEPDWLQADETPVCRCGRPMAFVFSLDQAAADELNFGGLGVGYAFACSVCSSEARWLTQC